MKTLRSYFQVMLLISYIDTARILKNYFLHFFLLKLKLLQEIASLDAIAAIFVRFLSFLKNTFTCTETGNKCYIRVKLNCNSYKVIYFVQHSNCRHQYVGSALEFKQRFRIHISDIKTNKERRGTPRCFRNICCHPANPHSYLQVQLKEQVPCNNLDKDI